MRTQQTPLKPLAAWVMLLLTACGGPDTQARYTGPIATPIVYVANSVSGDVSAYRLDDAAGSLAPVAGSPFAAGVNPTSIVVSPSGRVVLMAHGTSQDVWAYTRDQDGALTPAPGAPMPLGDGPLRSIAFDASGRFAFAAGHGISALLVDPTDGSLRRVPGSPFEVSAAGRVCSANPSAVVASRRGFLYAITASCIAAFAIDASTGSLTAVPSAVALSGPNREILALSATGELLVAAEVTGTARFPHPPDDEIDSWLVDGATGAPLSNLAECRCGPFLNGSPGFDLAIASHPSTDPCFVYVTRVTRDTGMGVLRAYVKDRRSDLLVGVVSVPTGPSPSGLAVDPGGRFVFVANGQNVVQSYGVDPKTGAPTPLGGPVSTGAHPIGIAVSRPPRTE
jgi:6-phosphogluconolactonase (cycloisomerase 2 family)